MKLRESWSEAEPNSQRGWSRGTLLSLLVLRAAGTPALVPTPPAPAGDFMGLGLLGIGEEEEL